jgi:hypothetical protein
MNTPLTCLTCGAAFHQCNLKQKYCSATCRNKALYAKRKHQSAEVQQLSSIIEQLVISQERVKDLETQFKDLRQLEQENKAMRTTIQQLTIQPTSSIYHIELRKMSMTQILDEPYVDFYVDGYGNKTITTGAIYLCTYSNNGNLLSEQEMKSTDDELLYLMEVNNITDIDLIPCGNKSLTRP